MFNKCISQSYPDFTEIVEQNMPAVVIVNATRSKPNTNNNQFQSPPGMPDEFNDLFKNSLMRERTCQRNSSSCSGFILSSVDTL